MRNVFAIISVVIMTLCYSISAIAYTEEEIQERKARKLESAINNLGTENSTSFEHTVYYFERAGEKALSPLLKELRSNKDEKKIRINILYILGRMGISARKAIPVIISFLRDEDSDTRAVAVIALGRMKNAAKDTVPSISRLVYDSNQWVSKSAITALKNIGTDKALEAVKKYAERKKRK